MFVFFIKVIISYGVYLMWLWKGWYTCAAFISAPQYLSGIIGKHKGVGGSFAPLWDLGVHTGYSGLYDKYSCLLCCLLGFLLFFLANFLKPPYFHVSKKKIMTLFNDFKVSTIFFSFSHSFWFYLVPYIGVF